MTAPLFLALFASTTAILAPRYLLRAGWVRTSPRWGIWAWQAVTLATVMAVFLVGLTLALPILPLGDYLAAALRATHLDVLTHYETPAGTALALTALLLVIVLATRTLVMVISGACQTARHRRLQLEGLQLVGVPHADGFTVVDHSLALVYCLPGRRRVVVVTRAALEALTSQELSSVLAHERSHLRARHDLALSMSAAVARSFVGLSLFRIAHEEISTLVEMQADDAASGDAGRLAMASALVTLGSTARPSSSVVNARSPAADRVRRLVGYESGVRAPQRAAVGLCTMALIAAPVALALAPALEPVARDCCESTVPTQTSPGQ